MENPKLTEILEQFRLDAIEWRATRDGHCWTVRQKAYQSALDTLGVEWLDKTQSYFKSRLDDIESDIKKHNCSCGFSCDDDRYFQTHVIREHQEFEIPQDAPSGVGGNAKNSWQAGRLARAGAGDVEPNDAARIRSRATSGELG